MDDTFENALAGEAFSLERGGSGEHSSGGGQGVAGTGQGGVGSAVKKRKELSVKSADMALQARIPSANTEGIL